MFPFLSAAATSLSGAQLCGREKKCTTTDRGHLHCQPLGLKAIGGPYYWQTGREVQDSTVVSNLSCKDAKKTKHVAVICTSRSEWD